MSPIIVHCGPLDSYYYFEEAIIPSIREQKADFLMLLPVNRAVRLLKKRLVDAAPAQVLIDPPIHTFDDFLLLLYRRLPGAKHVINQELLLLIVEKILNEQKRHWRYLASGASITTNGLVKKTTDMISELRRFGYDSTNFSALGLDEKKDQSEKFSDFELLLSGLDQYLGNQFIDEPFARHCASQMFTTDDFNALFPQVQKIFISGYGLFTPAMFKFIEKAASFLQVQVKIEYCHQNPTLFRHTLPAVERLRQMGAQIREENPVSSIAHVLFNRDRPTADSIQTNKLIEIQPLNSRAEEVAFIAAKIRQIHQQEQIPLPRIAVTFPNLERYVPLIRQQFREYGLPFNLSTGFTLNQSPLIRQFIHGLEIIAGNFEFLNTWQFLNINRIEKAAEYNPHLIHKLMVQQRIRYLTSPALKDLLQRLPIPETESDPLKNETHQVQLLINLLNPFYAFPRRASVHQFREAYLALLDTLHLLTWYQKPEKALNLRQKENEFRAFNRFMKMFDRLIWMLNQLYGDQPLSLEQFLDHLRNALSRTTYNLSEWPDYGVQIMPRLEIQAIPFEILFIGGLVDGELPRASVKDIFFNDQVRAKLNLLAAEELLDQDRFIYYALIDSSARRIIQTYPRYEDERALVPSTFLSDLQEVAEVIIHEAIDDDFLLNRSRALIQLGSTVQNYSHDDAPQFLRRLQNDLVSLHPSMRQQLLDLYARMEAAWRRVGGTDFSQFEGNCSDSGPVRHWLNTNWGQSSWSITRLESYAFCPMQFFLETILNLEDLEPLEEQLTSLERGNLIHEILYKFYKHLDREKATTSPLAHRDVLFAISEQLFQQLPFEGFFWNLEKRTYFGTENEKGLLDIFLEYDQQKIAQTGFVPSMFEYAFGYRDKNHPSAADGLVLKRGQDQIKLIGKIDRIDTNDAGLAMIFDYKTGKQASAVKVSNILQGIRFQLPLYMLALSAAEPLEPVYGAYYLVKDARNCQRVDVLADREAVPFLNKRSRAALPNHGVLDAWGNPITLPQLLDFTLEMVLHKVHDLLNGQFNHTAFPDDPYCQSYCRFRRICQKNVAKLKRLHAPPAVDSTEQDEE